MHKKTAESPPPFFVYTRLYPVRAAVEPYQLSAVPTFNLQDRPLCLSPLVIQNAPLAFGVRAFDYFHLPPPLQPDNRTYFITATTAFPHWYATREPDRLGNSSPVWFPFIVCALLIFFVWCFCSSWNHIFQHFLYPMPQQHTVLERSCQFPIIFQPREIWAHRTAHQHILLKIHGKPVTFEHFLQNFLKAHRLLADG